MQNSSEEVGFVQSVKGKVALVDGLPTVTVGELVVSEKGAKGYIGGLYPTSVEVYLLTEQNVEPGEMFKRSGEMLEVAVGDFLLGKVIGPLGDPAGAGERVPLELPAVGISGRQFISQQFDTGIALIDTIFPIGKGQRELVMGEQRSGKSEFLLNIVGNLKGRGIICVYALIGKPVAEARDVSQRIMDEKFSDYTVMVATTATDSAPLIFLTPQTAMAVATYFQRKGKDVLVILDDMGMHARNYREMALLSNRPPGRESYPGDVFYQQAKLLERGGLFTPSAGSGSITIFPVMELVQTDFTSFISTNLMAMTDGHLLFRAALAQQGKKPAIDISLSVTRVGGQTQQKLQNALGMKLKETLARGVELEAISRFGSDLPPETKAILLAKKQIEEMLNQESLVYLPKEIQTAFLSLPFTKVLKGKDLSYLKQNRENILKNLTKVKDVFAKKDLNELFLAIDNEFPQTN